MLTVVKKKYLSTGQCVSGLMSISNNANVGFFFFFKWVPNYVFCAKHISFNKVHRKPSVLVHILIYSNRREAG